MDEQGTHEDDALTLAPTTLVSRRRPKALWGVLAAVIVGAGALAVTSAGDDPAVVPPLPIALGSTGGNGAAEPAAADSMLAAVTYVAGDDLPALGGEAPAYRLDGPVDEAQVQALADALGVSGDVVHQDGTWTVTGDDGATLEVYEGMGASWWFSAVAPDVAVGGGDDCVETSSDGQTVTSCRGEVVLDAADGSTVTTLAPPPYEECPANAGCAATPPPDSVDCAKVEAPDCTDAVEPPADLPTEDEARAVAVDVLAATGMDTHDAIVSVEGPYDSWYVTLEPKIDGRPTGLFANVSVGSGGTITSAGGYLGTPEALGDYPLLTTQEAIDRLNDQGAAGFRGYGYASASTIAEDVLGPVDTTVPAAQVPSTTIAGCKVQPDGSEICELPSGPGIVCPADASGDTPVASDDPGICPPGDLDPVPPLPEPAVITLTRATPSLVLVAANDGSTDVYLVPAYRFTGDAGIQVDAPAIADTALAGPSPTQPPVTGTVTLPVEPPVPDPGGTGGGTPPSGCEPLVEEDSSGTTITIQPCAGIDPTEPTVTTIVPETTTSLVTEE